MKLLESLDNFPLDEIVMPAGWRDELQEDRVKELAADIKAGTVLPPLVLDGSNTLWDGRNRYEALQRSGYAGARVDRVEFEHEGEGRKLEICSFLHRKRLTTELDRSLTRELHEILKVEVSPQFAEQPRPHQAGRPPSLDRAAIRKQAEMRGVSEDTIERKLKDPVPRPPKTIDLRVTDGEETELSVPPDVDPKRPPHIEARNLLKLALDHGKAMEDTLWKAFHLLKPMQVAGAANGKTPLINSALSGAGEAARILTEQVLRQAQVSVNELDTIEKNLRKANTAPREDERLPGEGPRKGLGGRSLR